MAAFDIPKGTGSASGSTSQDSMSKSPRPSPPSTRREMYISFNHLHKNLSSFVEEPESEEEEYLPKKKEPWRKRQIPDYRKVKIGEYYNDTPVQSKPAATDCSGGESDKSARSSFDSDINAETEETHHVKPHTQLTCSGCATVFAPVAHKHTPKLSADSYEFAKMRYMAAQKGLKIETKVKENEKYRCNWPGCRMVFCKPCAVLMRTPKGTGGVGGNLKDLKELLDLRREAQASVQESSVSSQEPTNALN
ncbi:hypothetical protein DFH27DRAFT_370192 [Peziza echinospora]|nr:hypothetical protein DFH27DRAFT_370192 [Peziza echinospora]